MKSAFVSITAILLLLLLPATVFAKNGTIGIYAVIDQVTFEPVGGSPNLVRISGVFVVPVPMSSGDYGPPQRGYLYFRIRPGMEDVTRREWNALQAVAGTGRVVGFGYYWMHDPIYSNRSLEVRVHPDDNAVASPDLYPRPGPWGIVEHSDKGDLNFDTIAAQLRRASR
jgi:hypothetical protein